MNRFWKINLIIDLMLIIISIIIIFYIYYSVSILSSFFYSLDVFLPYFTFLLLIVQVLSLLVRFFIKKNNKYGLLCIFCTAFILLFQLAILYLGAGLLG